MKRLSLNFTAPGKVAIQEEERPAPSAGQVLVQTQLSAISAGSELLVYRGQFPADLAVDENLAALSGDFHYPLKYGYACVGEVIARGKGVDAAWLGRPVFAFNPHESHFLARPADLLPVPEGLSPEAAVFLPNMETAVNLVMDGRPLIGEDVLVFGQGVVGLLTTALLAQFPLRSLVTLDRYATRRAASLRSGAQASLDPGDPEPMAALSQLQPRGADLSFEMSGAPEALDQAIAATGFAGRIVVGSWYGTRRASLDLGGHFHRSRLRLISSQVSTLAPEFSGRWSKARRFDTAWQMLARVEPQELVTHRFPITQAAEAYRLLDQQPAKVLQVLYTYD